MSFTHPQHLVRGEATGDMNSCVEYQRTAKACDGFLNVSSPEAIDDLRAVDDFKKQWNDAWMNFETNKAAEPSLADDLDFMSACNDDYIPRMCRSTPSRIPHLAALNPSTPAPTVQEHLHSVFARRIPSDVHAMDAIACPVPHFWDGKHSKFCAQRSNDTAASPSLDYSASQRYEKQNGYAQPTYPTMGPTMGSWQFPQGNAKKHNTILAGSWEVNQVPHSFHANKFFTSLQGFSSVSKDSSGFAGASSSTNVGKAPLLRTQNDVITAIHQTDSNDANQIVSRPQTAPNASSKSKRKKRSDFANEEERKSWRRMQNRDAKRRYRKKTKILAQARSANLERKSP